MPRLGAHAVAEISQSVHLAEESACLGYFCFPKTIVSWLPKGSVVGSLFQGQVIGPIQRRERMMKDTFSPEKEEAERARLVTLKLC